MFSNTSSLIRSRLGRKVFLSIVSVFVVSMGILLVTVYYLMSHSLEKKDRELILAKAGELQFRYEKDGIAGLRTLDPWVFLRLESPQGATLLIRRNKDDDGFDLSSIEEFSKRQLKTEGWVAIPAKDDEDKLVIHSQRLTDGSFLQVGKSTEERENNLELLLSIFFGVSIPLLLTTILLGAYISGRITGSIRSFIKTLNKVLSGELSSRVPTDHVEDELSQIALLFNRMLEKIELLILGMRETVDDVSHDLRTPVTRFKGLAEQALQHADDPAQMKEAMLEALESADQMMALLNVVMDISEAEVGTLALNLKEIDLNQVILKVCDLYQEVAEDKDIKILYQPQPLKKARADFHQMQRAFANLLDNAVKYSKTGGQISITTRQDQSFVEVSIRDSGIGIDEKDLSHIWERHFRCDRSRSEKGLGLGLSLVQAIVRAHTGSVQVTSTLGSGSIFTIRLPIAHV